MARRAADRVKAVWTGTGTGTMTLGSAASGEPVQGFPASLDGQAIRFLIKHETAQESEVSLGVYTHSTGQLTRLYRYYPTPGGSAVSFSAGTKFVSSTTAGLDFVPTVETTDPDPELHNINTGYLQGDEWINTATPSVWKLVDHGVGSPNTTTWVRIDGSGGDGDGVAALGDLDDVGTAPPTAGHLLQADGDSWEGVASTAITGDFRGAGSETLAAAFSGISAGADAAPTQVSAGAVATYTLTEAGQLHKNAEVRTGQATQDLEVPANTPAGRKWMIKAIHDGATVSVVGDAGSVNGVSGGVEQLVNGGVAIVEVDSNAGTAPVVLVRVDIILPPTDVGGTKTYDNEDSGQDFRLTSTSTQTFSAAASYSAGFYVNLFKETTGDVTLDGADADYVMQPSATEPAVVTVMKVGTALIAFGSNGSKVLDAA